MAKTANVEVKLVRSLIGCKKDQIATAYSLLQDYERPR